MINCFSGGKRIGTFFGAVGSGSANHSQRVSAMAEHLGRGHAAPFGRCTRLQLIEPGAQLLIVSVVPRGFHQPVPVTVCYAAYNGMLFRSVVLLAITALVLPPAAHSRPAGQNKSAVDQWIQQSYEATQRYRSGDLTEALKLLGSMTKDEQEKAVGAIRAQIERIAAGWPPRKEDVVPWTPRLLRALAALHMEAAIVARNSKDRDAVRCRKPPSRPRNECLRSRHCPDRRAGYLCCAVDPGDGPGADGAGRVHGCGPHPHAALS